LSRAKGGIACARSLPPWRWLPLFRCQHVLKDHKAHKERPDRLERKAPPGRRVRKDRLGPQGRPDRKEKKARLAPPALPAYRVRREPVAASVRQGRPVRWVHPARPERPACMG
jgi:hypothetical protein